MLVCDAMLGGGQERALPAAPLATVDEQAALKHLAAFLNARSR